MLGLVAEIESDCISSRTKEALPKRKAEGMKLGRSLDGVKKLRLDLMASKIDDHLAKGIDKQSIANLLGMKPGTIFTWLKVRRPEGNPAVLCSP